MNLSDNIRHLRPLRTSFEYALHHLNGPGSMFSTLFGPACSLELSFDVEKNKKYATFNQDYKKQKVPIYQNGDDICGTTTLNLKQNKKIDHHGIKVELVGQIDVLYDKSSSYDFLTIAKDLEPPGLLVESRQYHWRFNSVDQEHETYRGNNVRLRYFVRVTIIRNYSSNIISELDFAVQHVSIPPEINNTIKMEVGIEDCLHIEFEYDRSRYNLKDVIVGKVYFIMVRLKIKTMEIQIVRTETCGCGPSAVTDTDTISRFEIMDGSPVRGECIPVRMYLGASCDLTPTFRSVLNKFSVKYHVNLVLVDEEDRRYYKKQEIFLWRKTIG